MTPAYSLSERTSKVLLAFARSFGISLRDWHGGFSPTPEALTMLAERQLEIGFDVYCDVTQPGIQFRTRAEEADEYEPN